MKDRKELDNILEDCLERMLTGGETVAQCLERYPRWAEELEPLLRASAFAGKASSIRPRPEFRERARHQMRAALQEMAEKRERRFSLFRWQPRWATAIIAVLVLVVASSGTVAASTDSMPDEFLYPVKLATERVRLTLTPSELGKAELYLELADRRVNEIIAMADKGKSGEVESTARRLNTYLDRAADLMAARTGRGVVVAPPPQALLAPTPPSPETAPGVAPAPPAPPADKVPEPATPPPPEARPEISAVPPSPLPGKTPEITTLEPEEEEKERPQSPERPAPPEGSGRPGAASEAPEDEKELAGLDREARLRMIMIRNAIRNSEVLRDALERVPEKARPALLRAIARSDDAYERLLEVLRENGE